MKSTITFLLLLCSTLMFGQSKTKSKPAVEPERVIAENIFKALQKEDAELLLQTTMPDAKNLQRLLKATYADNPDILSQLDTSKARALLSEKIKESFNQLVQKGKEEGIAWKDIELKWSGYSMSRQGEVLQSSIPFHVGYGGSEYRVVVDYCTQLADNPLVISLGQFKWEGKYK